MADSEVARVADVVSLALSGSKAIGRERPLVVFGTLAVVVAVVVVTVTEAMWFSSLGFRETGVFAVIGILVDDGWWLWCLPSVVIGVFTVVSGRTVVGCRPLVVVGFTVEGGTRDSYT